MEPGGPALASLPMAMVRYPSWVERETGIEPATACLEGRDSTTELLPLGTYLIPPPYRCRALVYSDPLSLTTTP